MQAVLMAAGKGTRISRHIGERPKCTLDIGGEPLIRHTVRMLLTNDINVSIVVGYRKEAVMECLTGLPVSYFYNPFFDVTNSIASLWFARSVLERDDVIIANGDVYWDEDVLEILCEDDHDPVMLADSSRGEEGDYLFSFEDDKLLKYGKDLKGADVSGEYVGIAKVGARFQSILLGRLQNLIDTQQHGLWWEDVLYSMIHADRTIYVRDIRGYFWAEIDFVEDYDRIITYRRAMASQQASRLKISDRAVVSI